jgi:hypothetical protein
MLTDSALGLFDAWSHTQDATHYQLTQSAKLKPYGVVIRSLAKTWLFGYEQLFTNAHSKT